jgi:Zn-dependent protease
VGRQTFFLARLFGIRVGVHATWIVVFAFVTAVLARGLETFPPAVAYLLGAVFALTLFASIVAHELAHALVARRYGVRTGSITLFLFGGVAEMEAEPGSPRADALIALAGPAMSAAIAVAAFALTFAVDRFAPDAAAGAGIAQLAVYVGLANGVLAVFNLLPAYPMDGGRVLRAIIWARARDRRTATIAAARVGMGFAVLFVALGVLAAAAEHDLFYGWTAIMGAFLLRQGWTQERALRAARVPAAKVPAAA